MNSVAIMADSSFMVSLVSLAIVSLAAVVGVAGAPAGTAGHYGRRNRCRLRRGLLFVSAAASCSGHKRNCRRKRQQQPNTR